MLFQARRFVEYFPPFTLIFAAFAWFPLLESQPAEISRVPATLQTRLPFIVLLISVSLGLFRTLPVARSRMDNLKPYDLYAGASRWLEQNTAEGELVFQTDWDDFPRLFFYNTHNTYLIGLDPTYMQMYDEDRYDLWVPLVRGEVNRPSQFIANVFHARYVHTDLNHQAFIEKAAKDPYMTEVYRDDQSVIFQVNR
jgi:hypothetical protein